MKQSFSGFTYLILFLLSFLTTAHARTPAKNFFQYNKEASEDTFCENLWDASRLEIEVDDDTGVATNFLYNSPFDQDFNMALNEIPSRLEDQYDQLLKRKNSPNVDNLFNALFIARPKFSELKECNDVDSSTCRFVLVKFLTDFTLKRLSMFYSVSTLSDKEKNEAGGLVSIAKNPEIEKIENQMLKHLGDSLVSKSVRNKITNKKTGVFNRVKSILKARVKIDFKRQPEILENFITRIDLLKFGGFDCSEVSRVDLNKTISSNFYITSDQRVLFCPGSLKRNQSEYSFVWFLAHEMAHIIGPCHLDTMKAPFDFLNLNLLGRKNPSSKNITNDLNYMNFSDFEPQLPYGKVMGCLRNKDTANVHSNTAFTGLVSEREILLGGLYCQNNTINYIDQIDETFSDWMATEVLSEYMSFYFKNFSVDQKRKGLSNIFRGSDEFIQNLSADQSGSYVYLSTDDRLNRIIFANESIRKQVGCANKPYSYNYCSNTH